VISRRAAVGMAACAWLPRVGRAQTPGRVYRLGVLRPSTPPVRPEAAGADSFAGPLRELGYVEGQNLIVERRDAQEQAERLPALARELVQSRVDVILAIAPPCIRAAKQATTTIPIVFLNNGDPVAAGLVAGLARTGNNLTGVLIAPEGDREQRRHAHTECVLKARKAGRLPTEEEWRRTQPRPPSLWRRLLTSFGRRRADTSRRP